MALTGIYANWGWAYGGSTGGTHTMEFGFAPSKVVVHSTLSMASGDGLCVVGISHYRSRPNPNGPEQSFDFNWDPNFGYPPIIFDQHFTYAKAELNVGAHQQAVATVTISFFD
jgi:hypothetical protein